MKKAIVLTALILSATFPARAGNDKYSRENDFDFNIHDNGTAEVVGYLSTTSRNVT